MAGLREQKKLQNQQNIIHAARKIFSEKGYQPTTMAEIAKDAEVGTGTLYNYYPSKGALLLAVFTEEMKLLEEGNPLNLEIPEGDIVEIISGLVKGFTVFFDEYPKKFWREIMHVMTEDIDDESTKLRKGFIGLDEEMIHLVEGIIKQNQHLFLVPVEPIEAALSIYSVVMMQTMFFIYDESVNYEQYIEQLDSQIRFIFAGKINFKKG